MLANDNSIHPSSSIPYNLINPTYLNVRRSLLQIIKSLNTKQYFSSRTYYTAVLYIDYYFLINNTNPNYKFADLLLISLCALILSAKYFEIDSRFPDIKKFIYIISHITKHRYTFTLNDVLKGELTLLKCLQYQLQYHSLYSYTIFYFCHGIIFHNDSFLIEHKLNIPSNEVALNKFLEKVYIHARELMDYIVHQGNYICLGNDCHLSAVAILVKILSAIKGSTVNEVCDLFRKVYNVDVEGIQFNNIFHIIEEQYVKMQMMKEKIKQINMNSNNNVSYLNIEMQQYEKRKSDCNESMLMVMVPELRESCQCEGDKIFMKLLEEDVLFLNREDEDNFMKRKRSLSASYESSLSKMMLSESSLNIQICKYHKDSCHLIMNTNVTVDTKDSRSSVNSLLNDNLRKSGKSLTYCFDINEFKNHLAKYKKNQSGKKKNQVNEIENEKQKCNNLYNNYNVQNTNINMKRILNNNGNNNYNNDVNSMNYNYCHNNYYANMNNNVYSDYVKKLNYYQQLQHNTIIINNNIHINNYANNNNNNNSHNQFANYVNMNVPIMDNNNNVNNYNQTIYFNNNTSNQNNNLQFANFPQQQYQQQQYHQQPYQHQNQQQPFNYYQYNNYYQQYNPIQKNLNFKVNSYPINNNNINPYTNTQYFYNKHY